MAQAGETTNIPLVSLSNPNFMQDNTHYRFVEYYYCGLAGHDQVVDSSLPIVYLEITFVLSRTVQTLDFFCIIPSPYWVVMHHAWYNVLVWCLEYMGTGNYIMAS